MTHKSIPLLRFITCSCFVTIGLLLIGLAAMQNLEAQLTSQGSFTEVRYIPGEAMLLPGDFREAAFAEPSAGPQIILGMLLILLGFGLYTYLVVRSESIKTLKRKKP